MFRILFKYYFYCRSYVVSGFYFVLVGSESCVLFTSTWNFYGSSVLLESNLAWWVCVVCVCVVGVCGWW